MISLASPWSPCLSFFFFLSIHLWTSWTFERQQHKIKVKNNSRNLFSAIHKQLWLLWSVKYLVYLISWTLHVILFSLSEISKSEEDVVVFFLWSLDFFPRQSSQVLDDPPPCGAWFYHIVQETWGRVEQQSGHWISLFKWQKFYLHCLGN